MTKLHDQLARIAGPVAEPTAEQVAADLARGRVALRRRRTAQAAAGSAFTVAAVVAAVAVATAGARVPADEVLAEGTFATVPATATAAPSTAAPVFELKAYKGAQPDAFTVDKVPGGWEVQGVTEGSLTVGPVGMADKDPNSFVGKVAVMLQSVDEHGKLPGTPQRVLIGDREGFFVTRPGSGGVTLFIKQPSGINLEIQVWENVGWTRAQIAAFAEGVRVNANARPGRG